VNFREFARRGLVKVKEEWTMAMFCHNVKRMHTLSLIHAELDGAEEVVQSMYLLFCIVISFRPE
jgi:hypothetical protein